MEEGEERLKRIAREISEGGEPESVTVRTLLESFGAQRRGFLIVQQIQNALNQQNLVTEPDWEGAYIDGDISFKMKPPEEPAPTQGEGPPDPTNRIGKLASANRKPTSVAPDDSLERAITLMLANDFSQLPVMTGERDLKGIVSWATLGSRLGLGQSCSTVRECMEPAQEISSDASLFSAIDRIIKHEYVLVRNTQRLVTGVVTTSDLSLQFQQLGEPFLLIGEIENYIRRMLLDKYSPEDLAAAKDPSDERREVESVSDLTFGEYGRLLEHPDRWSRLGLRIDRSEFVKRLSDIRRIRNDVMHFDPDGIPDADLDALRDFVGFMQKLAEVGAI